MRILEIKNNLVKISYDVNDNLALSGFAVIEDTNCPYVAQIVNLKADGGNNYAILKLLFTFNDAGVLKAYNGTIPSENAQITSLPTEEILKLFRVGSPIFVGNVSGAGNPFCLDMDVFTSGLLICSNNLINTGKLVANIFPQINKRNKKAVLLDTTGDYYSENSFVFGKNFKLPLNAEFLDFIFDNDLDGVEPVSKAIIQDIFIEVKNYLQEIPQGYLPIDMLVNVVQEQYSETKIPELVLLKNKLIRYKDANIFASSGDDVLILRSKAVHSDSLVIDVSQCDSKLMKNLIGFIYDTIATIDADTCIFANINNDFADKKLLRKTMVYNNIYSTVICSHEFKYLPDLKQIIPNMLFFAPQTSQHDFAGYNTFLSKLNNDEFIVYGEFTQKIPFIVQLAQYDDSMDFEVYNQQEEIEETESEPVVEEEVELETNAETEAPVETAIESKPESEAEANVEANVEADIQTEAESAEVYSSQIDEADDENIESVSDEATDDDELEFSDENEESEEILEHPEIIENQEVSAPLMSGDDNRYQNISTVSDITFEDDRNVISISTDEKIAITGNDELLSNGPELSKETLVENSEMPVNDDKTFEDELLSDREILEKQVADDVDASLYKKVEEENLDDENKIDPNVLTETDEITNEDLDYIETLNASDNNQSDDEEIEIVENVEVAENKEDIPAVEKVSDENVLPEIVENETVENSAPSVASKENNYIPIYTPDEFTKVEPDEEVVVPTFKPGDVISHPKYGQGVVEKMINYGNKTLCSINFVNLGRRLLDPAISDIQLVGREGAVVE